LKEVIEMNYSAKGIGIVFAIAAATVPVPQLLAQATPATAPQSSSSGRSPLATQLGVSVYPKNKQDQGQQAKDENECYNSVKQQTGINPAAPPPQQAEGATGAGAKGAAKGAAVGAIAGNAGGGAAVGAIHGRRKEKRAERQADQQPPPQPQSMDTFKKAFSSCMDTRKYSVQ
jgi:hypothetical protein